MNGRRSTDGYASDAKTLAAQYESIRFEDTHRDVMHLFPAPPARVLDIGAGSGRDAAALARCGYRVSAAEPTAALRAEGQRLHAGAAIDWTDDGLPDLPVLTARGTRFDLILLTAVWMHLDAAERAAAMPRLAALLAPGGRIVMTLRHGPVPPGRRMFEVGADETIRLAAGSGLRILHRGRRADTLGRADIGWTVLAFEAARNRAHLRPATSADRAALGALHVACWRESYAGILPQAVLDGLSADGRAAGWRGILAAAGPDKTAVILAEAGGEPVGFISYGRQRHVPLAARYPGEIEAIYLLRCAQRIGTGRALMAEAARGFAARGIAAASLWVLDRNAAARAFYAALGGVPTGHEKPVVFAGQSLVEIAYGFEVSSLIGP